MTVEEFLAITMFNAYNDHGLNPWKTFDGRDVPRWNGLTDQERDKRRAAARRAENCTMDGLLTGDFPRVD